MEPCRTLHFATSVASAAKLMVVVPGLIQLLPWGGMMHVDVDERDMMGSNVGDRKTDKVWGAGDKIQFNFEELSSTHPISLTLRRLSLIKAVAACSL